jgi:hypothetical protein
VCVCVRVCVGGGVGASFFLLCFFSFISGCSIKAIFFFISGCSVKDILDRKREGKRGHLLTNLTLKGYNNKKQNKVSGRPKDCQH